MRKPKMMIFDYGHTLCYEPEQDYARGWRAAMEHAVENPHGITAEQLYEVQPRGIQPVSLQPCVRSNLKRTD